MNEFDDVTVSETNDDFQEEIDETAGEAGDGSFSADESDDGGGDGSFSADESDDGGGEAMFEGDDDEPEDNTDRIEKKRKRKLIIFGAIAAAVIILIAVCIILKVIKSNSDSGVKYTDTAVERRTIQNTITGSSSIEPNDSYEVSTIKSGDITADYIKEGDIVQKGDKLYQFDDDEAQKSLTTAQNSLTKAQQSYVDAVKQKAQTVSSNEISMKSTQNSLTKALNSLEDAQDAYDDQYVKASINGKVREVSVKEGDTVNNGAQIATVYDDTYMKLRLPFNDYDAENVYVGASAEVSVSGSGDTLYGTVTEKSSQSTATDAHTMVTYVTVEVANPGALTESDKGSAVVNGVACADTASFTYKNSEVITAKTAGTLETLSISEGDGVYGGEQVAYISSDTASSSLTNAQLSYDDALLSLQKQVLSNDTYSQDSNIKNAQLSLEDAQLSLEKAQEAVEDYTVTAPIEGTVVTKNAKSGDTIDSSNSSEPLCVIYDLSCVKFSVDVDETEIALVQVGQKATVTADAVDGEFEAEVITVPVNGTNQNGVTVYTIILQIDDYGDLLPGMNVDAEIVVEEAADVLTVPLDSVSRGNIVFVKDDGTERENDVTDMINGAKNGEENSDGKDASEKEQGNGEQSGDTSEKEQGNGEQSGEMPERGQGNGEQGADGASRGLPSGGDGESRMPSGTAEPVAGGGMPGAEGASGGLNISSVPLNIEIPEGYRAILVETGINDTSYIEIKSGLSEGDMVRTIDTMSSSANASFGSGEENAQQQMGGMMGGGMGGGMPGGGGGGGMPGGGGGGGMGGGMR